LAVLAPLVVALVFGALLLLAAGISLLGGALRRSAEPWLCGYAVESDQMRYGARNLYREVVRYLPWIGRTPTGSGDNRAVRPAESLPRNADTHTSHLGA
jgi:hypothetical protein